MLPAVRLISEAAELAARRHNGMARKGRGNEPYINHLAEVANLLALVTDGADAELVAAGWLHDTIEDTETTREELAEKFSERVAALVVEVTDDMSLPKAERRAEADRRRPAQIARRQTDQDRRQGQQYPRAHPARPEPGRARRSHRLCRLGREGCRGMPGRQRAARPDL